MEIWILVIVLFLLMLLRVPVAISLIVSSLLVILYRGNPPTIVMSQVLTSSINSFPLLAIPLFTLAAILLNTSGVAPYLYNFTSQLLGRTKGAVGYVNILSGVVFSGMSGSAVAEASGLGRVQIKSMNDKGYRTAFSAALAASSATTGPVIPPSVPLVVYGVLSGASISALFLGGVIPGLLMSLGFIFIVYLYNRKNDLERGSPLDVRTLFSSFIKSIPALLAPAIILGGIWGGIFSPTEAAGMSVVYVMFIGIFLYKSLNVKNILESLIESSYITASILFIVAAANLYGWTITILQIPEMVKNGLMSVTTSPIIMLFIVAGVLLIAGCFMEMMAIMLITVPIFLPVLSDVGVDPVHFGVVMVITLMLGLLTPPFGLNLFIVQKIANVPIWDIIIELVPFFILITIIIIIIIIFPSLVTFLPGLL